MVRHGENRAVLGKRGEISDWYRYRVGISRLEGEI
jgi:hypothetical protein